MKLIWSALVACLLSSMLPLKTWAKDQNAFFSDNPELVYIVVDVAAQGRDVRALDTYFRLHGFTVLKTERKHRTGSPTVFTVLLTTFIPGLQNDLLRISQEAESATFTLHGNGNLRPKAIYSFISEINDRQDILEGNERTKLAIKILSSFGLIPFKFVNLNREMGVGISMFLVDLSPLKDRKKAKFLAEMELNGLKFGPHEMATDNIACYDLIRQK